MIINKTTEIILFKVKINDVYMNNIYDITTKEIKISANNYKNFHILRIIKNMMKIEDEWINIEYIIRHMLILYRYLQRMTIFLDDSG